MRFYGMLGLCVFSLTLVAVYTMKKAKEKKHETEEVQKVIGVHHKIIQKQGAEQPAEIPLESDDKESEQQFFCCTGICT